MIETQPATVSDFTGGITDNYLNAEVNRAQVCDNFVIEVNGSLKTRPGSVVWIGNANLTDTPAPDRTIPPGQQKINTLINFANNTELLVHSAKRLYYRDEDGVYQHLTGPTGNDAFEIGASTSHLSCAEWNDQLLIASSDLIKPKKVFRNGLTGEPKLVTAGLPRPATPPTLTPSSPGTVTDKSYLYAIVYVYEYQTFDQTFVDFSATVQAQVYSAHDVGTVVGGLTVGVALTNIPALSNGTNDNYDLSNIKKWVCRTIAGGTEFYKVAEVSNATVSYTDTMTDDTLQDQEGLYINGGVLENEPPPRCKIVHTVGDITYYANLNDGSGLSPNRYLQSVPGDPDSIPRTNAGQVDDAITGFSSVNETPIILCKRRIFRVEGAYDEYGRGGPRAVPIDNAAGCISARSCVRAEGRLFWAGTDGFYMTDGFKVQKVSDHLNQSYRTALDLMTDPEAIEGVYFERERRIYWASQSASAGSENDMLWVLDLRPGVSSQMTFTTISGSQDNPDDQHFFPTSICVFKGDLYRADTHGYVFRHTDDSKTDPRVELDKDVALWGTQPIIWRYVSVASNFGTNFVRKWVTRILLTAKNIGNASIQINAINDDGRPERALKPIRFMRNFAWGDRNFAWGDPSCRWSVAGMIQEWRRFPARGLRLSYLQIEITNAAGVITTSAASGTAEVNNLLKLATLTGADAIWPTDVLNYTISFDADDYKTEYLITSRSDSSISFADPLSTAPAGVRRWEIRGKRKGDAINLLSYTIHWAPLTKSHTTFETGSTGGLAE